LHLKEIEIKGFKSFANKIKLNITSGITVIVGPNGCGKSNITDAVRWILGEQNIRSLRGSNLTDMIFSGNIDQKMRNIAEVSILFDNVDRKLSIDSEQVELKRVVYRSGDTENYINGLPCKLRDIHELFWGTGLGKNSYSIIAQGKVDFVLNAKPTERRILFEEAANISSYNNKKDAAIKKLDIVENNLLRINDILSEVKENLAHYKKKADDLKSYHFCRDYIRKLEFYLLSQQYLLYHKNTVKYEKKISDVHHEIVKIEELLKNSKKNIMQIELEKEHLEKQLNDSEDHFQESEKEKNSLNNQLIVLKQKKLEISQRIANLCEDVKNANKQFIKFKDTISDIDKDIQETNQDSKTILERYEKGEVLLEQYHRVFSHYEQLVLNIEDDRESFTTNYINGYREEKIKEETLMRSLETSLLEIEKERIDVNNELQHNKKWRENIEKNMIDYESEAIHLKDERSQIENLLTKNKLLTDRETDIIRNQDNDIILKNKEKDFLEELIKNHPNQRMNIDKEILDVKYFQGIQWFREMNDLVEHIPDQLKKLVRFILHKELYLISVDHSEKIADISQFLKTQNMGQIKVIADDIISRVDFKTKKVSMNNKINQPKILGFANQLISCPSEYKNVFEILLGHILVVEDIATALSLVKQLRGQWIIASLDGIVIDFNGIITLNFLSGNKITDNVDLPVEKIEQLKQEIQYINGEKKQHHEILENLKNDNQEYFRKMKYMDQTLENHTSRLHEENNHLLEINKKITHLENQLEALIYKQKTEKEKKQYLEGNILISQSNIKQIEEHMNSFQSYSQRILRVKALCLHNMDELKKSLENEKMKLTWNKEREILLQKRKNEMNHFIQTYHQEERQRQEKITHDNKEQLQLTEQEGKLIENLKNIMEQRKKLNEERIKYKEFTKEQESVLRKTRENIEINQGRLEEHKNRYHESEMSNVQNQEKMNQLCQTVKNQYNASVDEILLHRNEVNSQKEASQKIDEYKEKITFMGQINFDALQEYQKQSMRYNELRDKKEEIINSKEKLIILINEIDRVAEEHFYQTFLKVENYFKDIFQKLFLGGQVSLELTNDKKLLETGIEVMVQPPGKKLQNISLLSTGEKALTAIALLFALWKSNPSPFCFFDEIDSALDEANALRLASFLKNEDLKDAQIIIITHQRGVMESADALYGITMEGSGISKLMSVKILDSGEWKN